MDPTDVFDLDENGNVATTPLVGCTTMPAAGMFIVTRLEYAKTEPHLKAVMAGKEKPAAVQLAITPAQARELATRLNFLADHIAGQSKSGAIRSN